MKIISYPKKPIPPFILRIFFIPVFVLVADWRRRFISPGLKWSRVKWELSGVKADFGNVVLIRLLWLLLIFILPLFHFFQYSFSTLCSALVCLAPRGLPSSELEETAGTSMAMNIERETFYSTVPTERERPPGCRGLEGQDWLGVSACAWAGVKGVTIPFDPWGCKRTDEGLTVTWW